MTIEEKAKAYDEALEIARGLYAKDAPDSLHLERMFPILKEDEDEKIRKGLIDYFENLASNKDYRVDKNRTLSVSSIISYLEKQGEQKHVEVRTTGYWNVQDIEQKSADKVESSAFKDKLLELFQKFRYIKEDVPTNGDIIDYVDAHIQELIDTKPWSEEDEEIYRKCICAMRASACGFPEEEKFVEQVDNWLKSLRDRFTWKPSEKQMKWLHDAMESTQYEPRKQALISLYSDLMKLKEE